MSFPVAKPSVSVHCMKYRAVDLPVSVSFSSTTTLLVVGSLLAYAIFPQPVPGDD